MQRSKAGTQGRGVKMKAGQPTAKNLPDKGPTQQPFAGRVFYLDITSRLVAEKLEKDIKELGGTVEGFLSKEISYLITNKKEAKCTKSLKYPFSMPSPEPASGSSSARPSPSGHKEDCQVGASRKKPEKEDVSRGKSLLKKVIKGKEILPKNSILANALNWGVRILHLDEAKIYIDQKKRSLQQVKQPKKQDAPTKPVVKRIQRKARAEKLKSPFIKVEDSSGRYRPHYLVSPLFRSFQPSYFSLHYPVEKKPAATAQKATATKQNLNKTWHGQDEGKIAHNKFKEQKKRGYCECCLQKYEDLEAHLLSQPHKNYAQGPHYQDVDKLITAFEFDFFDWSKFRQEAHGNGLFIPPAAVKPEEKELPPQMNQVSPKFSPVNNLESGIVQGSESTRAQDAACARANNLVCHSEPFFTVPCPPQSICSVTCITDSFSKPPSSQVVTPTQENVSPTQPAEPRNVPPSLNESTQKDLPLKENDSKTFIEVELSETAQNDQNCSSEPLNCSPKKRLKMGDSLTEAEDASAAPPKGKNELGKDLEKSCPSGPSDTLHQLPHGLSPSQLHRKERKARTQEEPPCSSSCKVSVPLDDCDVSISKERLQCLFQSSDVHTEFYGFSCNSVDVLQCQEEVEEPRSSHGHVLWSLFSNTGSSASTFNGF